MAMTLSGIIPVIYDAFDVVQRELTGMISHVFRNSTAEVAALNQPVTYPIVPPATGGDITPGSTPPNDGDEAIGNDSMIISKSKYSPIRWSGEEQRSVSGVYSGVLRDQFVQAMRWLVNQVEVDLCATGVNAASRAYGTPGTTPFGTAGDLSDFAQMRLILDQNGAPQSDLHMVMSYLSMANIRGKQSVLFKVNEAGTDALLRQGIIGQVEGFDLGNSPGLVRHVKGTGASYQTNNVAGNVVGDTAIPLDTGTGTILAGDVFSDGDGSNYVVKTPLTSGIVTLNKPGLLATLADNTAVTVGNSYTPNLAFHRSAIHLITRAPAMPIGPDGKPIDSAEDVTTVTDPVSGLSFQVALYKEYRRVRYEIGLAWGTKAVKSEFIALGLG